MRARFLLAVLAMVIVVVSSNYWVQFPVEGILFGANLSNILTWGAFTYPVAFLVTDMTNRHFGPQQARLVVLVGFAIAVVWSIFLATPRIAIASGSAFLLAQFLDVSVFDRMRKATWWKAPLISSFLGSVLDTILFFGIAFAARFAFLDTAIGFEKDLYPSELVPLLDVGREVPRWVSWALGDFIVKMLVALALLLPYGALRRVISDRTENAPA